MDNSRMKKNLIFTCVLLSAAALLWLIKHNNVVQPEGVSTPSTTASIDTLNASKATVEPTITHTQPEVASDNQPSPPTTVTAHTVSLAEKAHAFAQRFDTGDYSDIAEFHDLVTLCNSVPRTTEALLEWEAKHQGDSDIDLLYMQRKMDECRGVRRYRYEDLYATYREAIAAGSAEAKLTLASLMPFTSRTKIELLSDSASWSELALATLAEHASLHEDYLNASERLFWMTLSEQRPGYEGLYADQINTLTNAIPASDVETVERALALWHSADEPDRTSAVTALLQPARVQ